MPVTKSKGADCAACLDETDRASLCGDAACDGNVSDAICYAANCPEVSECFGGYGLGVPGGVTPVDPISDPDAVVWDLHVYRGELPALRPDGNYWDIDALGWSPPDQFVIASVGSVATSPTDSPEDVYKPHWDEKVLSGLTAQSLRDGITFGVWDEDVFEHDYVGSSHFEMSNDTFDAKLLTASCDTEGLVVCFYTKPTP